jgi:hypothetical protein
MKKLLLIVLLLTASAWSAELWSELYSEDIYRSEAQSMKDTYYGTAAVGLSFSAFDAYIITHRYTLTQEGCLDVGPGIRKSIQISDISLNPFGEVLFQKDSNIGMKIGIFISYRRKL